MLTSRLFRALLGSAAASAAIVWGNVASIPFVDGYVPGAPALPDGIERCEPGWRLKTLHEFPEKVVSIAVLDDPARLGAGQCFVGTTGAGCVFKITSVEAPQPVHLVVGYGMGDSIQSGTCSVNALAVRDIDHDGEPELIAATSQIAPRGRPRLYVWGLSPSPALRDVLRPNVQSSWSHGLGFVERAGASDSLFGTFCGYGEVVEYHAAPGQVADGFSRDSLGWKQVGQLPASGEATQSVDADNDGETDVCFATGYAAHGAAIHVYSSPAAGAPLRLRHVLDEEKRFGNVRFLVAPTGGDGAREIFAWWCTDLEDGDCEFIRYRLGPNGLRDRQVVGRGVGGAFWPRDGQMAFVNPANGGGPAVWFATDSGNLWCSELGALATPRLVLHSRGGIGPITGLTHCLRGPALLVGIGDRVVRLERE